MEPDRSSGESEMDCIDWRKLELAAMLRMRQSCLGVSKLQPHRAQYWERDINCINGWVEPPIV